MHQRTLLAGVLSLTPLLAAPAAWAGLCPNQLQNALVRSIDGSSRWGLMVQRLDGQPLAAFQANRALVPASTQKLVTSAVLLANLPVESSLSTEVWWLEGSPEQAVLRVRGEGNPEFRYGDLQQLADGIRAAGVTRIGRLELEDLPPQRWWPADWAEGDRRQDYGAPLSQLILERNTIGLELTPQAPGQPLQARWLVPSQRRPIQLSTRTVSPGGGEWNEGDRNGDGSRITISAGLQSGSEPDTAAVSSANPSQEFRDALVAELSQRGIGVDATRVLLPQPPLPEGPQRIVSVPSPPLSQLMAVMNRKSQNLFAEALLEAGARQGDRTAGRESILAQARTTLGRLHLPLEGVAIADGSGLSRRNRSTAAFQTRLLITLLNRPEGPVFRDSLALAGVNGTLRRRFRTPELQGRLWGKTGTLTGVKSLAGYFEPFNHPPVVFSFIGNGGGDLSGELNRLVRTLGQLESCP
jgi:D-alanyl-D-alanine carboxypeptidase/D-alanyl-D-alanine-endopeptidase (penicillin-binding protein 4)